MNQVKSSSVKNESQAYMHGLALSLALTISAFMLMWAYLQTDRQLFTRGWLIAFLVALACLQIFVQAVYFLHMSATRKAQWTLYSTLFTLFVTATIVFGSIWVMQNLHYNMVPGMEQSKSSATDLMTEHMQHEEAITR